MEKTLRSRGIEIPHIIGPQTAHKLHPEAKIEIERRLSDLGKLGRNRVPQEIDFTTYMLRYHRSAWVSVDRLETHWAEARVEAKINANGSIRADTKNIQSLTLGPISDSSINQIKSIIVDGQELPIGSSPGSELAKTRLQKIDGHWAVVDSDLDDGALHKRPGLQGPIDDAFLSPFVFVAPNPVSEPTVVDRWVDAEFNHAQSEWRRHFRGDVRTKRVDEVSVDDKQSKNLVLFGTPDSNPLIAEVMMSVPLSWTEEHIGSHGRQHSSTSNGLVAIYPSPFAADRYVVINSGFTFREYAYLNNARQIPMLPDWAIVDVSGGATTQLPGKIVEAGFFDESWQLRNAAK